MKYFSALFFVILFNFSTSVFAQTLFEMSYPADEQASGCVVRHTLSDTVKPIAMVWTVTSVCSGKTTAEHSTTFSKNTMKAWPTLLREAASWGSVTSNENMIQLHHWGHDIKVYAERKSDVLGAVTLGLSVRDSSLPTALQQPLFIDLSHGANKQLATAIGSLAFSPDSKAN